MLQIYEKRSLRIGFLDFGNMVYGCIQAVQYFGRLLQTKERVDYYN